MRNHFLSILCGAALTLFAGGAALAADSKATDDANALFDKLDANHDGLLAADEIPAEKRKLFERLVRLAGKESVGKLTRDEFAAQLTPAADPASPPAEKPPTTDKPKPKPAEKGPEKPAAPAKPTPEPERPAIDPAKMFDRLDKKQSGKLSIDDVPEPRRELFKKLLADAGKPASGSLTRDEFIKAVENVMGKQPGKPASPASSDPASPGQADPDQVVKRLMKLSKRSDGKLTIAELPERLKNRFDAIDANHDGLVDETELRAWLAKAKARATSSK